ncbi:MAG: dihydrofolate reductase [Cellvibrionaceae bacterium]
MGQTEFPVALIVAMAKNRIIGKENTLPWRLPSDLKHFKAVTLGKPVIMGRKTFESIGRPLPGRENIVITRQKNWTSQGVSVETSLESAIVKACQAAQSSGAEELMVIGGAEIYAQALPLASRIYISEIQANVEGDAAFPELDEEVWREVSRVDGDFQAGKDDFHFQVVVRER